MKKMKKIIIRGICLLIFFLLIQSVNSQVNIRQQFEPGDSYGVESFNGVLGGLGGAGNYAAVPHNTILNTQINGSLECWVYLLSYNELTSYIVQKGSSFIFGIGHSGIGHKPFLYINGTLFTGIDSIPLNQWVHVGVAWFQSTPNSLVYFFKNGSPAGAQSSPASWINNTDSLTIGGSRLSGSYGVNGFVDEVRLWSNTRSASDFARTRFIGIADSPNSNVSAGITSAEDYKYLLASWTFNAAGTVYEYINNLNGRYRGNTTVYFSNIAGQPIPYNLALYLPGNSASHVRVSSNPAFSLSGGGTIESWVYCDPPQGYTLISKGATLATTTFRVYIQGSGLLSLQLGNTSTFSGYVPLQKWTHIAVSWTGAGGGNYSIKFYINGKLAGQQLLAATIVFNNDPVRIGNLPWDANNNFAGYIDELRVWSREMTPSEIIANMFNTSKSGSLIGPLVASWDFEGNLNNISPTSGLNGSFNIGTVNNCRFSGYRNETTAGPISASFDPHPTALIRSFLQNPFPGGYSVKAPNKTIPAGANTVYDTLYIPGSASLNSIEVFLAIQNSNIGGTAVNIKAPNGFDRYLTAFNGGNGNDILTFILDGGNSLNNSFPPWSHIAGPIETMGNFGGTNVQGNWILSVQSLAGQPEGKILGWGLRINNSVTYSEPVSSNIPSTFSLKQNYPNPFNPYTEIKFDLPKDEMVKISVFDVLGSEIIVLVNEFKKAGEYNVKFDAAKLSSGVYFYSIAAGEFTDTKKMVLVK